MKHVSLIQFSHIAAAQTDFDQLLKHDLHELEDACLVEHLKNSHQIKIHQTENLALASSVGAGFWGLLVGSIFLMPVIGLAVGAVTGALAGSVSDIGLDDEFLNTIGHELEPGSAAILILSRQPLDQDTKKIFSHAQNVFETPLK